MIAYIDDNEDSLKLIQLLFKEEGMDLDIYSSPLEFLQKQKKYKVIISDFDMPIDGQEFLRATKSFNKEAKTIIYSGKMENVQYVKSLEVDSFLLKPQDNHKLIKTVKYFLLDIAA